MRWTIGLCGCLVLVACLFGALSKRTNASAERQLSDFKNDDGSSNKDGCVGSRLILACGVLCVFWQLEG